MPRRNLSLLSNAVSSLLNRTGLKRLEFVLSILASPLHRLKYSPVLIRRSTALRRLHDRNRSGFTLLEVMIATAVTLLMMVGLAQMFKMLGDSMNQGRGGLELNNRLRGVMHRVRTDLDSVTAPVRPPLPVGLGQGYMKYYEGPASDYTFAVDPTHPRYEDYRKLTRFGDMDDIFMATVKAKDTWFTGKVPRFIAEKRAPLPAELTALNNGTYNDFVTIASQFAEVIIFAQPEMDPAVPGAILDRDGDGVPDGFRLHYRALLIRPDLNLNGELPYFRVNAQTAPTPPGSTPAMYDIFQQCDLSVRRISYFDDNGNPIAGSRIAANTLEDLANPANRFAHIMLPVPGTFNSKINGYNAWTMPILDLEPALQFQQVSLDDHGIGQQTWAGSGFLHRKYVLEGDRTGEDLLATNLLAFDVRAYDSSAPVITLHEHGVGSGDHNHDDVTLRPGDPGFGNSAIDGVPDLDNVVAYGEFVDLNWAGKRKLSYQSELSGRTNFTSTSSLQVNQIASDLFRSGLVRIATGTVQIFQPSYDTFTNLYEQDSVLQTEIANNRGVVTKSINGDVSPLEGWRKDGSVYQIDAGHDGIDNAGSLPGIDDPSELETSPPFPVHIRGLQISIRLEDRPTKQFKQMSTIKEFVTN